MTITDLDEQANDVMIYSPDPMAIKALRVYETPALHPMVTAEKPLMSFDDENLDRGADLLNNYFPHFKLKEVGLSNDEQEVAARQGNLIQAELDKLKVAEYTLYQTLKRLDTEKVFESPPVASHPMETTDNPNYDAAQAAGTAPPPPGPPAGSDNLNVTRGGVDVGVTAAP